MEGVWDENKKWRQKSEREWKHSSDLLKSWEVKNKNDCGIEGKTKDSYGIPISPGPLSWSVYLVTDDR